MRTLRPWQAWLLFVVGGGLAQVMGVVMGIVFAIAVARSRGAVTADSIGAASKSFAAIAGGVFGVGLTLVASVLVTLRLAKLPIAETLGLSRPRPAALAAACVGVLGTGPMSEILVSCLERVLPRLTLGTLDALKQVFASTPLWMLWPVVAIVPGLTEELFFRGAFQRAFGAGPKAVLLSGIAFALFHVDPHHAVAVLPVSIFMAWTAARTGCLWVPVIAHVANNSLSVVLVKLGQDVETSEPGRITTPWWVAVLCVALVGGAVIWLRRTTSRATHDTSPLSHG